MILAMRRRRGSPAVALTLALVAASPLRTAGLAEERSDQPATVGGGDSVQWLPYGDVASLFEQADSTTDLPEPPVAAPQRRWAPHNSAAQREVGTSLLAVGDGAAAVRATLGRRRGDGTPDAAAPSATTVVTASSASSVQDAAVARNLVQSTKVKQTITPRSWFALTFSFAFVVKALCMTSNVVYQVSPFPEIRKYCAAGDTGETDPAPFFSILYGGCQWCFYGLFAYFVTEKSGFLVLVYSNVGGACLGFYYIYGFQVHCQSKCHRAKLFFYYQVVSALVSVQILAMLTQPRERALLFSGLVSSLCSLLGSVALALPLPTMMETKCSAPINVPLLVVGLANASLWFLCGVMLHDPWIVFPNTFGMAILMVTGGMRLYYPTDPAAAAALVTQERIRRAREVAVAAVSAASASAATRRLHECGWDRSALMASATAAEEGYGTMAEPCLDDLAKEVQDHLTKEHAWVGETGGTC